MSGLAIVPSATAAPSPMKGGDVNKVMNRLRYIAENKKDVPVNIENMRMAPEGHLAYRNGEIHRFNLTNWSAGQLASFTEVPAQYFNRLREESPELLAYNVNHGLMRKQQIAQSENRQERRLFRTLDGTLRALVSTKFFLCDSYDLMDSLMPVLEKYNFEPHAAELTEKRLYLKATTPKVVGEVTKGDAVQFGVMISTSDVGAGSIAIEPYLYRLVCLNGLVMESKIRRRHVGRELGNDSEFRDLLTDETLQADKHAFLLKARDMLTGSLSPEVFNREIAKLKTASEKPIKNYNLKEVVDQAADFFGITNKAVKQEIVEHLGSGNQGAGLTQWGLINSFTAAAKSDLVDYDTSVEMERAAGQIIELNEKQWRRIAEVH